MAVFKQKNEETGEWEIVPLGATSGVEVSDTPPTNPMTDVWIDTSDDGGTMADYVIARGGNENTGYWEKWASGKSTFTYIAYSVTGSATQAVMGGYSSYVDISVPSGVFNSSRISVIANSILGTGLGFPNVNPRSATSLRLTVLGNQNSNIISNIFIHAEGRWK